MDNNKVSDENAFMEEYFKSNQMIASNFFEGQYKMFEMQQSNSTGADTSQLLMYLMEVNKDIVLHTLEAQKHGASSMLKGNAVVNPPINKPVIRAEQPEKVNASSSEMELEQWVKHELAIITGFPSDKISGSMKFEEDLGLVSINMVELFAHLVEQFPHLNRDIVDIMGATTIDEFITIMAREEKPKEITYEVLEKWIKTEISKTTGFPVDTINGSMKFEEDLGLVSINMIEIFSNLMEYFPDLNRDLEDVIGAVNIDELLNIILTNQAKKKEQNEYLPESRSEAAAAAVANIIIEPLKLEEGSDLVGSNDVFYPDVNPNYIEAENVPAVPEQVCERIAGQEEEDTTPVAIVRLFSDPTTLEENRILGISIDRGRHAFLTVENISNHPIIIGKFFLDPGKTFSFGTLSHGKTLEHSGLWYGLEARNIAVRNIYGPRASIRCDITKSNLDTMNNKLPEFYNGWSYMKNCAFFASTIWNSISAVKITGRSPLTAKIVYDGIIKTCKHSFGVSVPYHYMVYHANGENQPIKSTKWN